MAWSGVLGIATPALAGGGPIGAVCGSGSECSSTFCVDGVCCESACDQSGCMGCSPLFGTTGEPGQCAPIANGIDPKDACQADDPAKCAQIGTCDGDGACKQHQAKDPCGLSGECAAPGSSGDALLCVSVPLCDPRTELTTIVGAFGTIEECEDFRCSEETNTCRNACETNAHCQDGLVCDVDGICAEPIEAEPQASGCGVPRERTVPSLWVLVLGIGLSATRRRSRVGRSDTCMR